MKTADRRIRVFTMALWVTVLTATLLPVLGSLVPPGGDYAVHIARVYVLQNLANDPVLQRFYETDWAVLPNLAFDLISLALMKMMGPYAAGRTFVTIAILAQFVAVACLRYQLHGRIGLLPLTVGLFIYSAPAAHGLASFYLGQSLLLFGVSLWLASGDWSWRNRVLVTSGMATILFFTHLIIVGLYGLIVGVMRLSQWYRGRRLTAQDDIPLFAQFAIPLLLWMFVQTPALGTETVFGPAMARMRALASPVLYYQTFDFVLALVLLALVIWLLVRQHVRVHPVLVWPISVIAILGLLLPEALFGIWLINIRLPVIAVLLLVAAIRIDTTDLRLRWALAISLILFGAMKLYRVEQATQVCDARQRQFVSALSPLPRGARILPVMEPVSRLDCLFPVYWHMPALAVIEKSAFYPMMAVTVWPLALRPDYRRFAQRKPRPISPQVLIGNTRTYGEAAWNRMMSASWRQNFDYLVWMHPGTHPSTRPTGLHKIGGADFFTLYRIDLPDRPATSPNGQPATTR